MFHLARSLPSSATLAVTLIALACGATSVHASDAHDSHAAPAKAVVAKAEVKPATNAETKPAAKPEAHAAEPAKPAAKVAAGRDPLDIVRERLAEKLGAAKAPDALSPNVLRVVSRESATEATPVRRAATHAASHSVSREHTARLIAAQREAIAAAAQGPKPGPAAAAAHAAAHAAHWSYNGDAGPEAWAQLQPEFAKCSSGSRQSPIDIRDGIQVQLDAVQFDYRPTSFRVVDNGHAIQVNVGAGNSIEVQGRRYELLQFHFHRPSEERINGRQFDMVAHLVHKDPEGRLAVVAVLLDRGSAHPLVQTIWNNLPLEKGDEVAAQAMLDLNALLPADRRYFTYMGSLTTPPCSEGVLWMVMKTPVPISADQINIFSRLYPMNARPIQSASGRLIKESN